MTQASIEAFLSIEPKLSRLLLTVFKAGQELQRERAQGFTIYDLMERTGRPINTVSARTTELTERGWFVDSGQRTEGRTLYVIGNGIPAKSRRKSKPTAMGRVSGHYINSDGSGVELRIRFTDAAELTGMLKAGTRLRVQVVGRG